MRHHQPHLQSVGALNASLIRDTFQSSIMFHFMFLLNYIMTGALSTDRQIILRADLHM